MKLHVNQFSPKLNKTNLSTIIRQVASVEEADVIVYPELACNGYLLQDKVYEDAFSPEELKELCEQTVTKELIIGAALCLESKVYNCALYIAGGEIKHIHKKIHLPSYGMFEESRYYAKGHTIEAFDTHYGKAVMLVCEDIWRASTLTEVAALKPRIIYVLANSPARGFEHDGLVIENKWSAILQSTAILCGANVVFINRVGFEDGLGFWGGSRVITPDGQTLCKLPHFKEVSRDMDIDESIHPTKKFIHKEDL